MMLSKRGNLAMEAVAEYSGYPNPNPLNQLLWIG